MLSHKSYPKRKALSREQVFLQAKEEHKDYGEVLEYFPYKEGDYTFQHFPPSELDERFSCFLVYHFGIRWFDDLSDRVCIVTYGPDCIFEKASEFDLRIVGYDPTRYTCWAS